MVGDVIGSGASVPGLGARRRDWVRCTFRGSIRCLLGQGRAGVVEREDIGPSSPESSRSGTQDTFLSAFPMFFSVT